MWTHVVAVAAGAVLVNGIRNHQEWGRIRARSLALADSMRAEAEARTRVLEELS